MHLEEVISLIENKPEQSITGIALVLYFISHSKQSQLRPTAPILHSASGSLSAVIIHVEELLIMKILLFQFNGVLPVAAAAFRFAQLCQYASEPLQLFV